MEKKPSLLSRSILANIALMLIIGTVLCWLALIFVDYWTDHGNYNTVPDVVGMSYDEATATLDKAGLRYEISDSVFASDAKPGHVIQQSPIGNSKVKNQRIIYLIIKAFSVETVTLPNLVDISVRQAQSMLEGLGIKRVKIEMVPSEYKDLVLAVRINGKLASAGARLPITSNIILEVGEGINEDINLDDSLAIDSVMVEKIDLF